MLAAKQSRNNIPAGLQAGLFVQSSFTMQNSPDSDQQRILQTIHLHNLLTEELTIVQGGRVGWETSAKG